MVATLPHHRPESGLNATLLPIAAILAGIGVAAGIATAPGEVLNAVVMRSHLPDWVPAAAPPIGVTGRTLLALVAGALVMMAGLGAAGWWRLPRRRRGVWRWRCRPAAQRPAAWHGVKCLPPCRF